MYLHIPIIVNKFKHRHLQWCSAAEDMENKFLYGHSKSIELKSVY